MYNYYHISGQESVPVPDFLPMSLKELESLGFEQPDFILVTGDAYVDHSSFGAAIIGKLLWSEGYSVGIIAMPDCKNPKNFKVFGEPRLAFLITSGNVDSMVNNYTVAKKKRNRDDYSEEGKPGRRPDRAVITYSKTIKKAYPSSAIIIGGLEASLRRLAHYDYWSNNIRTSILLEAGADILVYGMGERQILEIAALLNSDVSVQNINFVQGTVYKTNDKRDFSNAIMLPSYAQVSSNKLHYAKSFKIQYENTAWQNASTLVEEYGDNTFVVQNPPAMPLTTHEMDFVYSLNYARTPHPSYQEEIPSIQEVKFSLTSSRGCFGGCNFCALSFHQGRHVSVRSHESILAEAEILINMPDFKGYIHDVGGPTANFRHLSCKSQTEKGVCTNKKCLAPNPCKNLEVSHKDYLELLRKLRSLPKIKKVFIRSGIRFDYLMLDKDDTFFKELVQHHISGQLKVAPEHIAENTLKMMGKPPKNIYDQFVEKYYSLNHHFQKKQYLVPYLMSSHPGSTLKDAVELAEYLRDNKITPEQVQDFYPTPGTVSTCMYYTGLNPFTMKKVYTPTNPHEKALQRALIQYKNPKNHTLVLEALKKAGRTDLIGFTPNCLVRPPKTSGRRPKTLGRCPKPRPLS